MANLISRVFCVRQALGVSRIQRVNCPIQITQRGSDLIGNLQKVSNVLINPTTCQGYIAVIILYSVLYAKGI